MLINHTDAASIPVASLPQIQRDVILSVCTSYTLITLLVPRIVHEVPSFALLP